MGLAVSLFIPEFGLRLSDQLVPALLVLADNHRAGGRGRVTAVGVA